VKIVSLLPAATEIVCGLGLRSALVGRSHECDFPADVAGLPALTRARIDSGQPSEAIDREVKRLVHAGLPLYELDEERLHALAPDVVVTQAACEVCAISYEQVQRVARRAAPQARVLSLQPARWMDILTDVRTVALACGVRANGERLVRELEVRLTALVKPAGTPRPRVAMVEWLDPPMLGAQWVPDIVQAAGGEPVGPPHGTLSPYVAWDSIADLLPDAVVVAPCGFDLSRALREAEPHRDRLHELAPRVLFMDGNAFWNRPGPRLVEAAESLAAWLTTGTVPANCAG
jgi:iron complex transport system substrate-binding protein